MRLPIGHENFGEVRTKKLNFIDKTLFIKEVLDDEYTKVSIITRPRRFGKTFNLSTLHHFLAKEVYGQKTVGLFEGLKISQVDNGTYIQYQGKYQVIFISFKDIKCKNFQEAIQKLQSLLQELYRMHRYLSGSDNLEQDEKEVIKKFLSGDINNAMIGDSLRILSEFIYKHSGKKVFILIDEYDTPIQAAYVADYYDDMVNLIRGMFSAVLKTNPYLDRAVVSGILCVAKESLFSELNNVKIFSVLDRKYSEYFGFTETEVSGLLKQAGLSER